MATVLVADDDPDVLRLIELRLRFDGIDVASASDGAEALSWLENGDPDLVILDVMMPVLDGLETCRRIRALPRFERLPILLLTARARPEDIEAGFSEIRQFYAGRQGKKKSKRINPNQLRKLEAAISKLEEALAEAGKKLENPIEASESIAELGERYVSLQAELDAKWDEWHALFED